MSDPVKKYLAAIGRRGGSAGTDAQNAARRENAKKAGRPKGAKDKSQRKRRSPPNTEAHQTPERSVGGMAPPVVGNSGLEQRR